MSFRFFWGVEDLNLRRLSQQIYSLPHLTALETPQSIKIFVLYRKGFFLTRG